MPRIPPPLRLRFLPFLACLFLPGVLTAAFRAPSASDRLGALGDLRQEPASLRPLFQPDGDFAPVPPPEDNDWLARHHEPGQTFDEYVHLSARPIEATRRVIYLLPIGDFPEDTSPPLEELRDYAARFFQLEVRLLPAYDPHDLEFKPRQNRRTGQRQILTTEVMAFLKQRLPDDACCLLGITMTDLYPSPSWNFVFGQASLVDRVGIYSLARYDPAFSGDERGDRYRETILQRACKVLVHETAHSFGLHHCIYFECVVNGANHLRETDRHPQHLCPICLRKLRHATGLDPTRRYRVLAQFYRARQWFEELDFVNRQLGRIDAR